MDFSGIMPEEPDLSRLAGCWCRFGRQTSQLNDVKDDFNYVYIALNRYNLAELREEEFKFCKRPSKNAEDYKDIDTFLRES